MSRAFRFLSDLSKDSQFRNKLFLVWQKSCGKLKVSQRDGEIEKGGINMSGLFQETMKQLAANVQAEQHCESVYRGAVCSALHHQAKTTKKHQK